MARSANKIALNVDKTNFVIFHSHAEIAYLTTKLLGNLDVKRLHKLILSGFLAFSSMRLIVGSLTLLNCPGKLPGQLEFSTN